MDNKTILGVFKEAFLRSLIVLMATAIIGFALFFILKMNSDQKDTTASNDNSTYREDLQAMSSEEVTEEITTENTTVITEEPETTEEITTEEITTEEITTEEITTEETIIASTDKKILVLNSTRVSGLAKAWMNKLQTSGFSDIATGNYSAESGAQTRICVPEAGMGQDLLEYFTDATIEVNTISSGVDVSTEGVDIFIIIGSNDTVVQ